MADFGDMKSVKEWADIEGMVYATVIKRRSVAGVGQRVGSGVGTWLLTRKQWDIVKRTPLPGCTGLRT